MDSNCLALFRFGLRVVPATVVRTTIVLTTVRGRAQSSIYSLVSECGGSHENGPPLPSAPSMHRICASHTWVPSLTLYFAQTHIMYTACCSRSNRAGTSHTRARRCMPPARYRHIAVAIRIYIYTVLLYSYSSERGSIVLGSRGASWQKDGLAALGKTCLNYIQNITVPRA